MHSGFAFWLFAVGACSAPLPEEGTAAAELYRSRCGTCHRAVNPNTMYPLLRSLEADGLVAGEWEQSGAETFARRRGGLTPETPVRDVEDRSKDLDLD